MNIAKQDVALAKRAAEEKMKELSVKIKPDDLEAYKLALKNIAKNHSYAEGENLSFDDSDILIEAARRVMGGMGNAFHNIPEDERRKANVAGMIMAVNDYMISLAMEELNSPVIHGYCTDQLKVIYNATALRCVASKPRKGYIVSDAFEEQRGMSAEELRDYKADSLIKAVKANPGDVDSGAALYVEYQALAKRQENHGAVWRFFHRGENAARTALLNEMKEAMAGKITKESLRDHYTILESQRGIDAAKLKSDRVDALINAIKDDPDNMEKVADLYVEYQALARRQENHGAIWRYFHQEENAARTALLNEMKEAMAGKVSEEALRDLYASPSALISKHDEDLTEKAINEGLQIRENNPEKGFDYSKYKNEHSEPLREISEAAPVEENKIEVADNTVKPEELQNIGGVEKTRVYLPDLSETVGVADKADMIDEKSISAPSVEL